MTEGTRMVLVEDPGIYASVWGICQEVMGNPS